MTARNLHRLPLDRIEQAESACEHLIEQLAENGLSDIGLLCELAEELIDRSYELNALLDHRRMYRGGQ